MIITRYTDGQNYTDPQCLPILIKRKPPLLKARRQTQEGVSYSIITEAPHTNCQRAVLNSCPDMQKGTSHSTTTEASHTTEAFQGPLRHKPLVKSSGLLKNELQASVRITKAGQVIKTQW